MMRYDWVKRVDRPNKRSIRSVEKVKFSELETNVESRSKTEDAVRGNIMRVENIECYIELKVIAHAFVLVAVRAWVLILGIRSWLSGGRINCLTALEGGRPLK